MTLSETIIAIDGLRWHQTMAALPILEYHLSKLSDKDLEESERKSRRTHPLRLDLKRAMLSKFAPGFMMLELFGPGSSARKVKPIQGMSKAAALGIVQAVQNGLLSDAAWGSLVKDYDAICLTAGLEV